MSGIELSASAREMIEKRAKHHNGSVAQDFPHHCAAEIDFSDFVRDEPSFDFRHTGESFGFNTGRNTVAIWGHGADSLSNFFSKEHLPALFIRRLVFDGFDPKDGIFEWLFTGPNGGVTISVNKDTILMQQRFYNSYGFNRVAGQKIYANRHPETNWLTHATAYTGELKSLALSIDQNASMRLYANQKEISSHICLIDLTAHQMRFMGKNAKINGFIEMPAAGDAAIEIDVERKYQEMLGWGGITSAITYHMLSPRGKDIWWKYLVEYNLMHHREYPNGQRLKRDFSNFDDMEDATPHYYGDNFPNGEISDFAYIKRVQDLGGISIFEFWKLPEWIQRRTDWNQKEAPLDADAYAEAMIAYCKKAEEKTGRAPDIVGIQNEFPQSVETVKKMILALRKALDTNGYAHVKIHQADLSYLKEAIEEIPPLTRCKEAWAAIDYSAAHVYDCQGFAVNAEACDKSLKDFKKITADKPFISTEVSVNAPMYQENSYRIALTTAQLYHKNLAVADAVAIWYCWTLINTVQPSYSASRSLFGIDEQNGFVPAPFGHLLRAFGAYSRRIKQSMRRVEAACPDEALMVTAFSGKAGNTVVIINRSQTVKNVALPPLDFKVVERASQYCQNTAEYVPAAQNGAISVSIQPGEIVTVSSVELNKL
jgi:hypothetical protein